MKNYKTKQTVYIIFDKNDSSVSSFNSYLVAALKRQRIEVVFDKKGSERENCLFLGINLVLVVFSVPYTFSVACLEKLVKLHEFRQEKGHVVIPVFYDERASVIKEQMEMCEGFPLLEKSYSVDQVTKWRHALVQMMDLQGHHEYNDKLREESEFIENIVEDVFDKLYPTEHIGNQKQLLVLENLLCKQPWGRRTLAIYGKRGIGKTTLVEAAVDKMSSGYDADHFITVSNENITELLSNEDFKETPMEKFDLNNQDAEPCLRSKRVLIVLDDVRRAGDAEAFLGEFHRFGPGSLLIITSRYRKVLEQFHVNAIYELKGLNSEDSLKLFTRCFFGEDVTDEERLKFSMKAIESCDGNPSAIRSLVETMKSSLRRICHDWFSYTRKQPLSFTAAHNYQYPALDIASLSQNLCFNFVQEYSSCAISPSYGSYLKDLLLSKGFQIDEFEKLVSSEARKIDCTNLVVIDQLEPLRILNLRGCIEIKHLPEFPELAEFVRMIREWKFEGKILKCRLQKDYMCPHCKSANETTGSHIYFDITFWSILTTISNRIQSWEAVLFALLNLTGSKAKKILCRMEWQLTVYSVWIKRKHRLYRQSYRSTQVHRFIRNIILSIMRKTRLNINY